MRRREHANWKLCSAYTMGRRKSTEKARNIVVRQFLHCAHELLEIEGFEQVSTRKVASCVGFTSPNLYLYFQDQDELLMLAGINLWETCCRLLCTCLTPELSDSDAYRKIWSILSRCAMESPAYFFHFLFGHHSIPLSKMIDRYYTEIYPTATAASDGLSGIMQRYSDPRELLMPPFAAMCRQSGISEADSAVLNECIFSYFRGLLEALVLSPETLTAEAQQAQMMHAVQLLTGMISKNN